MVQDDIKEWGRLIKRKDTPLQMQHKVCSRHFRSDDVITYDEHVVNGEVIKIPRSRAALRVGAKPVIFEDYPDYYQPKVNVRKPPKARELKPAERKIQTENHSNISTPSEPLQTSPAQQPNLTPEPLPPSSPQQAHEIDDLATNGQSAVQEQLAEIPAKPAWSHLDVPCLVLPPDWCICNTLETTKKVIVHINPKTIQIDKSITFKGTSRPIVTFRGTVKVGGSWNQPPQNVKEAQKLLTKIDCMRVCQGTGLDFKPFSNECDGAAVLKGKRCAACHKEADRLKKREARKGKVLKNTADRKARQKARLQSLKRSKIALLRKVRLHWSELYYMNFYSGFMEVPCNCCFLFF